MLLPVTVLAFAFALDDGPVVCVSDTTTTAHSRCAEPSDSFPHRRPLVRQRDLVVGAAAIAATVAVRPFDERVNNEVRSPEWQDRRALHHIAHALSFIGGPGPFIIGGALVAAGEVTPGHDLFGVGARLSEGVLLAAGLNGFVKGLTGRALPDVQTRHEFKFARGLQDDNGNFVSFPSGHTAAAFALATTASIEADRFLPSWGHFVRPIAFTLATGVAAARIYQHQHWVSDLPLGAAIGMWSAEAVQSRARIGSGKTGSRALSGLGVAPTRKGMAIVWSSQRAEGR